MDIRVVLGILLLFGTTAWILYKLNVMRKVRRGLREKEVVALLVRLRNAALAMLLYGASCVCFLSYSLTRLSAESAQYQMRANIIEFLIGVCIATTGFTIGAHVLQSIVMNRLKQKTRERAWTIKFRRNRRARKSADIVVHK